MMLNKGKVIFLNLKYKSFYWSLGTTSFRTKNFNKKIEQQLSLLRDFWSLKENIGRDWEEKIQVDYYNFLQEVGFISGDANNKAKDAREKTSGLVSLGLIDENRSPFGNSNVSVLYSRFKYLIEFICRYKPCVKVMRRSSRS